MKRYILIIWMLTLIHSGEKVYGQSLFNTTHQTSGDTLLNVDESGRVGIGTGSPQTDLDIRSTDSGVGAELIVGNADGSHYLRLFSGRTDIPRPAIEWMEGDPLRFRTFGTSYTEHMRIGSNGNLGLAIFIPEARLDIQMAGNGDWQRGIRLLNPDLVAGNQLMLTIGRSDNINNAGNVYFTYDDNASALNRLSFGLYAVNDVLNILANGYVGIGTTEATEPLQVNGTVYSTGGGFRFPDESLQTTAASASGNTLDQAYDAGGAGAGRVIIADAGPVEITDEGGLVVNGGIFADNSVIIFGSGTEGGQLTLFDGDDEGGWEMDNAGDSDQENLQFFRDRGYNNKSNVLVLSHEGNIGIGTGAPVNKLEVADTIYSSEGGLKFPDETVQETAHLGGDGTWIGWTNLSYDNGNVGIGASAPITALHVEDVDISLEGSDLLNEALVVEDSDAGLGLFSSNDGDNGSVLSMGEVVSGSLTNKWAMYRTTSTADPAGQLRFSYGANADYTLNPSMFSISSAGNIGLGTTAPDSKLELAFSGTNGLHLDGNDDGDARIAIRNGGGYHFIFDDDNDNHAFKIESSIGRDLAFNTDGTYERLRITSGGNVGIGTSSPGEKLEVAGQIFSRTGGFRYPDETTQTAANDGGNTLDEAYDQGGPGAGRTITADAGALAVLGVDGALFTGTLNSGTIPATGMGIRMMWYPRKAAFRAGIADGTHWDDVNIGNYSLAAGRNTIASGECAMAMGYGSTVTARGTALGYSTTAAWGVAMGYHTTATGGYSAAMGRNIQVSGSNSIAIGLSDQGGLDVEQDNTMAIMGGRVGIGTIVPSAELHLDCPDGAIFGGEFENGTSYHGSYTGVGLAWYPECAGFRVGGIDLSYINFGSEHTVAMGYNAWATYVDNIAIGNNCSAHGWDCISIGSYTTVSELYGQTNDGIALGCSVSTAGDGSIVVGDATALSIHNRAVDRRFTSRFGSGYYWYTNLPLNAGALLNPMMNSWMSISDSTKKENYKTVNGKDVLSKIAALKLGSWNYKSQDPGRYRHYGPMAQEFFSAFGHDGIGTIGCDTLLASADVDGITMIAIKALVEESDELQKENDRLKAELADLESRLGEAYKKAIALFPRK